MGLVACRGDLPGLVDHHASNLRASVGRHMVDPATGRGERIRRTGRSLGWQSRYCVAPGSFIVGRRPRVRLGRLDPDHGRAGRIAPIRYPRWGRFPSDRVQADLGSHSPDRRARPRGVPALRSQDERPAGRWRVILAIGPVTTARKQAAAGRLRGHVGSYVRNLARRTCGRRKTSVRRIRYSSCCRDRADNRKGILK